MRVEIVTVCEHGKSDPHRWDPSTSISDEGWCPGGSRRVLAPGEYVLVEKVDGKWPLTNRVFDAIEDALIRETGRASMRTIETVVETYLDALAEGEQ